MIWLRDKAYLCLVLYFCNSTLFPPVNVLLECGVAILEARRSLRL